MKITKSRYELIREAADKLNIVGTGQPLEAEYADRLSFNVDPLIMQLAADGICDVATAESIPSEWFDSIAGLLANQCASLGGKTYDPGVKQFYETMLRRVTSSGPTYNVQETDYF
jgi:hypothetical protein